MFISQAGLALMGFSRYCPSSLNLTNFVVRRCRGGVAEVSERCAGPPRPGPGLSLGIWKSGNLKIQNFGAQKVEEIKILKMQTGSAQNVGKVWISREESSWPYLGYLGSFFAWAGKIQKK